MTDHVANAATGNGRTNKPRSSAWTIYWRLVQYAWRYPVRLVVSVVLALVVTLSFGALLVSIGTIADLTLYEAKYDDTTGKLIHSDPADKYLHSIQKANAEIEKRLHWAPHRLETDFTELVTRMRGDKMHALIILCSVFLFLALLMNVARYLQEFYAGTIGTNISADLGQEMYDNLMRQSVGYFEARPSGEVLARFANDIFTVNRGLAGVFVKLMREPFKVILFLAIAFWADWQLTLVGLCVLPPVAYSLVRIGSKMRRSVRRSLEKIAAMTSVVNETVTGIAIVKGYNMEEYETGRLRREIGKLRRFLNRMVALEAATGPITEFLLMIGIVILVLMIGNRVISHRLMIGGMAELLGALALLLDPIRKLTAVNNMIQTSVASAERVFELVDAKPDIVEAPDAIELPPLRESLRFENLHFAYDGETEVLKGVDFEIKKGELVALVGPSGAGKSTIVKLIPRFYDATQGAVKIDGIDIRQVTFKSLRTLIGIVTQDTILFAESVRDNIAYGQAEYSVDRVHGAAQAAHATEFIERLPEGFDTVIGESGSSLSGGQRQRLAIARAIIKDPAILILDEATSSLDSESEYLIQQALNEFVTGRTAIVIAHRLSTVRRADRILVMENGCVVQQGTHDELLAMGGLYKRLYDTQFGLQETPA
jgi:ATP-binding cassette, subfamily B, bacterial MsbA